MFPFVFVVYKKASTSISEEKIMLFLPQNDISLLKKSEKYWNNLGLTIEFFSNGINITKIPSILHLKLDNKVGKTHNEYFQY